MAFRDKLPEMRLVQLEAMARSKQEAALSDAVRQVIQPRSVLLARRPSFLSVYA